MDKKEKLEILAAGGYNSLIEKAGSESMRHIRVTLYLLICAVIVSVILTGCDHSVKVGEVVIVSGGEEYAPAENWIFRYDNGLAADGARLLPQDMTGAPEIPAGVPFVVRPEKGAMSPPVFSVYDESGEALIDRQPELNIPEEGGRYTVFFELVWGTEKSYEGYQYYFILVV